MRMINDDNNNNNIFFLILNILLEKKKKLFIQTPLFTIPVDLKSTQYSLERVNLTKKNYSN